MHTAASPQPAITYNVNYDVCDLNLIYTTDGYKYSLPRDILEGFFSGKAFDHKVFYTDEESRKLREDIREIFSRIMSQNPDKAKVAVMTAGAPGAGKTTLLRQDLEKQPAAGKHFAYICPDDVCLKEQRHTYRADLDNDTLDARTAAYNKWRPGSNAATHAILGNLIREGRAFCFGTTSSSPATKFFYKFLKEQGYKIRVLHISAPNDVRWGSIRERDKTFVQTTEADVKQKGIDLPQRINDTFLEFADEIEFYFRTDVNENAVLAAKWTRAEPPSGDMLGTLEIVDRVMYQHVKDIQDEVARTLGKPDLEFGNSLEKKSRIR